MWRLGRGSGVKTEYNIWAYRDLNELIGSSTLRKKKGFSLGDLHGAINAAADRIEQADPDGRVKLMNLGLQAECFFNAVAIHVDSNELIDALLRTDYKGELGDIHVPFPMIEFCFPDGISVQMSEEELRPFLLIHPAGTEIGAGLIAHGWGDEDDLILVFQDIKNHRECSVDLRLSQSLQENISRITCDLVSRKTIPQQVGLFQTIAKLAFALLLYIQAMEEKALSEPATPVKTRGGSRRTRDRRKKRRQLKITPLIPKRKSRSRAKSSSSKKWAQRRHWRKGSWRMLNAPRYKRNSDGSPRVIWVPPYMVHEDQNPTDAIAQTKTLRR